MKVTVLGVGEIGKAMKEICEESGHEVSTIELEVRDDITETDVLLVNIPYSSEFKNIVLKEIEFLKPELVIINSTVTVGTTREIENMCETTVVHSPVRGVHPHLKQGIQTFIKYVGATDPDRADKALEFLETLKLKTRAFNSPEETEMAKLISTTTYSEFIAWATEVGRICDKNKLDYDNVMVDWTLTYNIGYMELGMPCVVRPILKPNKGGFSGHCCWENTQLLDKIMDKSWKKHIDKIGKKQ